MATKLCSANDLMPKHTILPGMVIYKAIKIDDNFGFLFSVRFYIPGDWYEHEEVGGENSHYIKMTCCPAHVFLYFQIHVASWPPFTFHIGVFWNKSTKFSVAATGFLHAMDWKKNKIISHKKYMLNESTHFSSSK